MGAAQMILRKEEHMITCGHSLHSKATEIVIENIDRSRSYLRAISNKFFDAFWQRNNFMSSSGTYSYISGIELCLQNRIDLANACKLSLHLLYPGEARAVVQSFRSQTSTCETKSISDLRNSCHGTQDEIDARLSLIYSFDLQRNSHSR